MKKALSLFLAVLMLFGVLSIGASAEEITVTGNLTNTENMYFGDGKVATMDQVVIKFNLNGGTLINPEQEFTLDTDGFIKKVSTVQSANGTVGSFVKVPVNAAGQKDPDYMLPGTYVDTPMVLAPNGYSFVGWEFTYSSSFGATQRDTCMAGDSWVIPADAKTPQIVNAYARMITTAPEEETMTKVMNILVKVFGSLIGLLLYGSADAGQAFVSELFKSILG